MSLALRLPRKMHLARSSSHVPRLPLFLEILQTLTCCSLLTRCIIPCACHAKRHPNVQKCSEPVIFYTFDFEICLAPQRRALFRHHNFKKCSEDGALYILTSTCASHQNGVHFFDITTSKRGPSLVCFVHFDLEMCFALQRRALFHHLNFQKWSEPGVSRTF